MRIIHISPAYYPARGGAEQHMKEISEGLASRGHEVTVLTANVKSIWDLSYGVSGGLPETETINGVQVLRFLPTGGTAGSLVNRWLLLRGGWRSLAMALGKDGLEMLGTKPWTLQLIPYLLQSRADIVMVMNWLWPLAYHAFLARKLKRFVFMGSPLFHTAEAWSHRPIYRRMLAACDAVVVNTAHEAQFVQERGAIRVEVAGVGVHPASFVSHNGNEIRARYSLGGAPVVGFVGRQSENKGVAQLVEAMKTVWQWNPQVRLVLAGPRSNEKHDRPVEAAIERLSDLELQRLVRINEFDEKDKASLYDTFDVFALPSTGESFGISYLEAWLSRKPVIGSRIGSTQCVIDDGIDGLLVDHKSPQDIAIKIIDLLSDPDKRERMGASGYAKTMAHYTWEKVVDKTEKLYLSYATHH